MKLNKEKCNRFWKSKSILILKCQWQLKKQLENKKEN